LVGVSCNGLFVPNLNFTVKSQNPEKDDSIGSNNHFSDCSKKSISTGTIMDVVVATL